MEFSNFNTGYMEQDETIEMQIWEYVDGLCSEADRTRINLLIHSDPLWEGKYADISALNSSIQSSLELEQPSLRFSKNVMDTVARTTIAPATHNYINRRIVLGIGAFFMLLLGGLLIYAAMKTNWTSGSSLFSMSKYTLPSINYSSILRGNYGFMALAINVVLALVLVDKFLRQRGRHQSQDAHTH